MSNSKLTDAIILKGVVYVAKQTAYSYMDNMCSVCDLRRKCTKMQSKPCTPFVKQGKIPYFRKLTF